MLIGCPKEIKNQEYRVGLTPSNVADYVANGHKVIMENGDQEQKWLTEKTDQRMIRNTNFQNILNNTMHACEYSVE